MSRLCRAVLTLFALGLLAGAGGVAWILVHGVSARDQPTAVEVVGARVLRGLATPRRLRATANPVSVSPETLARARAHFADHCAVCHGNDGAGQTAMGQNLYPKAPDMRQAPTQSLRDGELFAIIRNGVRLTGMPAWGDGSPESDRETWDLVHFIRHLPRLTPEEVGEMEGLNPKSPAEIEEARRIEDFLRGGTAPAPAPHH